jgi:hypothetical protein
LKRFAAIQLLLLLLFNLFGYRIFFDAAQRASDAKMEAVLDKNEYNESELITIRIPVSLPYFFSRSDKFERVNGEINMGGKIYKYVKRRMYNGEITILCLPDHAKTSLETARNDFFKNTNDLAQNPGNNKASHPKLDFSKMMNSIYDCNTCHHTVCLNVTLLKSVFFEPSFKLSSAFRLTPEQPPELS